MIQKNSISKAFKRLDWSKIVPENTRRYTILVGETPVTLIVQTDELPVGHSSPKSIDSNNDLKTDDTRGDQLTDISQKTDRVKQSRKHLVKTKTKQLKRSSRLMEG